MGNRTYIRMVLFIYDTHAHILGFVDSHTRETCARLPHRRDVRTRNPEATSTTPANKLHHAHVETGTTHTWQPCAVYAQGDRAQYILRALHYHYMAHYDCMIEQIKSAPWHQAASQRLDSVCVESPWATRSDKMKREYGRRWETSDCGIRWS